MRCYFVSQQKHLPFPISSFDHKCVLASLTNAASTVFISTYHFEKIFPYLCEIVKSIDWTWCEFVRIQYSTVEILLDRFWRELARRNRRTVSKHIHRHESLNLSIWQVSPRDISWRRYRSFPTWLKMSVMLTVAIQHTRRHHDQILWNIQCPVLTKTIRGDEKRRCHF